MPKSEAKVSEVISASNEVLASNGGQMNYESWQKALTEKIGPHDNSLKHIVKNKLVHFWLKGFKDGTTTPDLWVVNDKSLIQPTIPLIAPKEGS